MLTEGEQKLNEFADSLIKEEGLENLDNEVMVEFRSDVVKRLISFLNLSIIDVLPSDTLDDFQSLLLAEKTTEANELCMRSIPEFDNFIADRLIEFRNIYLGISE